MANSDSGRTTLRPPGSSYSFAPPRNTLPFESDLPPHEGISEDFLFYLSRGSELLQDNQIEAAKEALELALGLQPQDLRSQGLLGVVYFRLGLYPRAIQIFEQIVVVYPEEINPKINLALCFVKTGQAGQARDLLEEVVSRKPDHLRAWAYLGLVYQFQQDFDKARAAFERAGQTRMAERMASYAELARAGSDEPVATETWELRAAAEDAFAELENDTSPFRVAPALEPEDQENRSGKWRATEPGEPPIPDVDRGPRHHSTPPPSVRPPSLLTPGQSELVAGLRPPDMPSEDGSNALLRDWFASRAVSTLGATVSKLDAHTLEVVLREPFAIRVGTILVKSPLAVARSEHALSLGGRGYDSPSDSVSTNGPIVGYSGPGRLVARSPAHIELVALSDETVTVREENLLGFSEALHWERDEHRFADAETTPLVRLSGRGFLALAVPARARSIEASDAGLLVRVSELLGWTGRVLPESSYPAESPGMARGFCVLRGTGSVLLA